MCCWFAELVGCGGVGETTTSPCLTRTVPRKAFQVGTTSTGHDVHVLVEQAARQAWAPACSFPLAAPGAHRPRVASPSVK